MDSFIVDEIDVDERKRNETHKHITFAWHRTKLVKNQDTMLNIYIYIYIEQFSKKHDNVIFHKILSQTGCKQTAGSYQYMILQLSLLHCHDRVPEHILVTSTN